MKAFLEEYGLAIFTLVCIAALIAMASPLGNQIREALAAVITRFAENPAAFAPSAGG